MEIKIAKKPKLELKLIPVLVIKRKTGNYYYNMYKGKGSFNLEDIVDDDNYQLIEKKGESMLGVSIQYFEEKDLIAFIFCRINTSSIKEGDIRHWKPIEYFFVDKDKYLYSKFYGDCFINSYWRINRLHACNNYSHCVIINSNKVLTNESGNKKWYQYDILKPFHDMFGEIVPISGNKMVVLDSLDNVDVFMRNTFSSRNTRNSAINKFLKYNLEDFDIPNVEGNFAVIQKIKNASEPTCVLRTFYKSPYSGNIKEAGRIYITKKDVVTSRVTENGDYVIQSLLSKAENWDFSIETFDKSVTKGTYLEYFGEIIEDIDYQDRCIVIWSFLKYPITEKLYKMPEMQDIMKVVFKLSKFDSPIFVLKKIFGDIDEKETDVYKFLKLNKYQLSKLTKIIKKKFPFINGNVLWYNYFSFIKYFKEILGENLSSFDNETTDWCIDYILSLIKRKRLVTSIDKVVKISKLSKDDFQNYIGNYYYDKETSIRGIFRILCSLREIYGFSVMKKTANSVAENFDKDCSYDNFYASFYGLYSDFLSMVKQTNMQVRIKPYFSTAEDVIFMHNTMVDYINANKNRIIAEKWDNRKDYWKKFEYSDDEFSIIAPISPEDLAEEGITLHHCVKSYIPRVSNGTTNVLFLRKKEKPNVPFYTIEVDNNDIVQQVHGSCNCIASSEVKCFVDKWIKAKKLKSSDFNKVR